MIRNFVPSPQLSVLLNNALAALHDAIGREHDADIEAAWEHLVAEIVELEQSYAPTWRHPARLASKTRPTSEERLASWHEYCCRTEMVDYMTFETYMTALDDLFGPAEPKP